MPTSPDPQPLPTASATTIVRTIVPADIPAVRAFLERYIETSVFLLSNLTNLGIRVTPSPMSGNFLLIEDRGALAGVFCLTRKGDLLAQTGGNASYVDAILAACAAEPFPVNGVLAEWDLADALWAHLTPQQGFTSVYHCKSIVYHLGQLPVARPAPAGIVIRAMSLADYGAWEPVDRAFCAEEGLSVMPDEGRRKTGYKSRADVDAWWGAFADGVLVSTACLNAGYQGVGQIGGVYTRPAYRRRGLAQQVMHELMRHQAERIGLREVVLFTAEQNHSARAFYEAMGFSQRGRFGLLFGTREGQDLVAG